MRVVVAVVAVLVTGLVCVSAYLAVERFRAGRTYERVVYDVAKAVTFDYYRNTQTWHPLLSMVGAMVLRPFTANIRQYVRDVDLRAHECGIELAYLRQWTNIRQLPYYGSLFERGLMLAGYTAHSGFISEDCEVLERAGLIPEVGDPDLGLLTWLSRFGLVLVYVASAWLGCCLGAMMLGVTIIIYLLKRSGSIVVDAPICPFDKSYVKAAFQEWAIKNPVQVLPGEGHATMARIRADLEGFCQSFLYRFTTHIRDIGGSLVRNVRRGKRLHICFPNLTSMDKHLYQTHAASCPNDVHVHRMQECNKSNVMGYMSYVDFHIPASDLADYIRAPTLVVTHPFTRWLGSKPHVFFPKDDGTSEGECLVSPQMVHMSTQFGTTYCHGYHLWQDEGVVVGKRGALTYHKIGEYGDSIVILLQPTSGAFNANDPYQLRSTRDTEVIKLSSGVSVSRGPEYFRFNLVDGRGVDVLVSSIMRAAIVMMDARRDNAFIGNVTAMLRSRFSADHQPMEIIDHAVLLTMYLCDTMALDIVGQHDRLLGDVYNMTFLQRWIAKLMVKVWYKLPSFTISFNRRVWLWLVGESKEKSYVPWAWDTVHVPNYEVVVPAQKATLIDAKKKVHEKKPFRAAGQIAAAPVNAVNKRSSGKQPKQRSNKSGNKGAKANNKPAPSARPQGRSVVATVPNVAKVGAIPVQPLPAVVKYSLRWVRANLHDGTRVAADIEKNLRKRPDTINRHATNIVINRVGKISGDAAKDLTDALAARANRIDSQGRKRSAACQQVVVADRTDEQGSSPLDPNAEPFEVTS